MNINCNRAQPVIYWESLNVLITVDNLFFAHFTKRVVLKKKSWQNKVIWTRYSVVIATHQYKLYHIVNHSLYTRNLDQVIWRERYLNKRLPRQPNLKSYALSFIKCILGFRFDVHCLLMSAGKKHWKRCVCIKKRQRVEITWRLQLQRSTLNCRLGESSYKRDRVFPVNAKKQSSFSLFSQGCRVQTMSLPLT